jgi:hypothetical protein
MALRHTLDATVPSVSGRARFALTTLRVQPCPVRVRLTEGVGLLPCAFLDGGVISARGAGVLDGASHLRPWWSAGVAARLSSGAGIFRIDAELGVSLAVRRDTFRFTPNEVIYRFSGPLPFVALGLSWGRSAAAHKTHGSPPQS